LSDRVLQDPVRSLVVIDEIDKADMDFPNDLLNELDKSEFTIRETGETVVSKTKPIVVITSNGEKPLPDAFLRRCVFHRIKPLDEDILKGIVRNRYYKEGSADETLIKEAVEQFVAIRKYLGDNEMSVGKNVSTSELLDWFEALKYYQFEKMKAAQSEDAQPDPALQSMIDQLEMLGSDIQSIPFQQVLFKNYNTLLHFEKLKSQK
ncbi:MAG: MoxR family ATPase, partial [Bacteroidota bacterium]